MPAPPKYLSAHAQLYTLAVDARREGLTFDAFWTRALRPRRCGHCLIDTLLADCPSCGRRSRGPAPATTIDVVPVYVVRFPTDTAEKRAALMALEDTRDGWRRAYERAEPARSERALVLLGPDLRVTPDQVRELEADRGIDLHAAVA